MKFRISTRKVITCMLWACCLMCTGCTTGGSGETEVVLETTIGNIRVALYDDTPRHRDNFVENVKNGMYNGVVFHRVIRNFMVQTGDPATRPEGYTVPTDANGDTIPERIDAEIVYPTHFHRRGELAAARDADDVNPQHNSDRFQFFFVTGKTCDAVTLRGYEQQREEREANALFQKMQKEHKAELDALRAARDRNKLSSRLEKLQDEARWEVNQNPPLQYNAEQKRAYKTHGGAPWLDGEYTIFGHVVEGMDVIEKIQRLKTSPTDVPLTEVRITKAYVVE